MTQHIVTRRVKLARSAIRTGRIVLPAGLIYWFNPVTGEAHGEFPHVPMFINRECPAALLIASGGGQYDPWCSLELDHDGPHVAHLRPGQPVAAWTDFGSAGHEPKDAG